MPRRKTIEEFIRDANIVHGDKYDYYKVKYIDTKTDVIIICNEHGEFVKKPKHHLNGQGCQKCEKKLRSKQELEQKAKEEHSDKYDYCKVKHIDNKTYVIIICKDHGMIPNNHLDDQLLSKM